MGGAFLVGYTMPWWQSAHAVIHAPIAIRDKIDYKLNLGIRVGLDHVNITLTVDDPPLTNQKQQRDFYFNERIELESGDGMRRQLQQVLQRGLPVPVLTVMDYLAQYEEGFRWSVDFRLAGYYCQFGLTLTLISWAWMNIFFMVIPRYGAAAMLATGLLALLSIMLYWTMLPSRNLVIYVNGQHVCLAMGTCFWTVFITGLVSCITGSVLLAVEIHFPGSLTFDLQLVEGEMHCSSQTLPDPSVLSGECVTHSLQIPLANFSRRTLVSDTTVRMVNTQSLVNINKQDSGISSAESQTTLSSAATDAMADLEVIATSNGSYLKSTISDVS